jgi:serine/threonine protein kinase
MLQTLQTGVLLRNEEVLNFTQQIAAGMACVTAHGIVHLDLAARNILYDHGNTLKIADFGNSRFYNVTEGIPSAQGFNYGVHGKSMKIDFKLCPPECLPRSQWDRSVKGFAPVFNERSDVWALGVVMWQLETRCAQKRCVRLGYSQPPLPPHPPHFLPPRLFHLLFLLFLLLDLLFSSTSFARWRPPTFLPLPLCHFHLHLHLIFFRLSLFPPLLNSTASASLPASSSFSPPTFLRLLQPQL